MGKSYGCGIYIFGCVVVFSLVTSCQKTLPSSERDHSSSHSVQIGPTGKIEIPATAASPVDLSVPLLSIDQTAPANISVPADTPVPDDTSVPDDTPAPDDTAASIPSTPASENIALETSSTFTPNSTATTAAVTYPATPALVSWNPDSGSVSAASSIQLTFNKPMQLKSGATPLTVTGCTTKPTITSAFNSDATQLIGTLSATGCESTDTYTVTFDSTSVTDSTGVSLSNPPASLPPHTYKFRKFSTLIAMKESLRRHHTATPLSGGAALIAGGWSDPNKVGVTMDILQTAEIYSVSPNTTALTTGNMKLPRTEHVAIRLQNNKVLLTGGYTTGSNGAILFSSYSELYDPTANTFAKVKNTGSFIEFVGTSHTMTILSVQKKVLLAGNGLVTTLLYDETSDSFSSGPDMKISRIAPLAVSLSDGTVLFVGGTCDQRAEIYDPIQNAFTLIKNPTNNFYPRPIGAALPDGRVLLSGYPSESQLIETHPTNGITVKDLNSRYLTCGTEYKGLEIFDPTNQRFTFSNIPNGNDGKAFFLTDGMGALFGAWASSSALIYDPSKNQILRSTAVGTYRYEYTITLLSDGSVLRSGGYLAPTSGSSLISTNTVDVYK